MPKRLESWKEIAAYLGREVRTVQRWAVARRLPVHRLPGGSKPRVFSLTDELDTWLGAVPCEPGGAGTTVAVLPFLNLGGGVDDQYFGEGLADDLINALVRLPGLRVIARTSSFSFSARGQDVREIGAHLGAEWLIEGSIRRDRERVRVSAQLVSARDGCHAWSERYDRHLTGLFAIQDDLAEAIANALELTLTRSPGAGRPTGDLVAYDLWVQGRSVCQQFTPAAFSRARDCYEASVARDPRFARAAFGLAELLFYGVQFGLTTSAGDDVVRAREMLDRSLESDELSGEAHALRGVFRGILDYDWPGAQASFRRAFELSPGSAAALWQFAWYHLTPRRQIPLALQRAEEAVALDPLSPFARGLLGLVLVAARQYGRAVEESAAAVALAPGLWWLHWFNATALLMKGHLVQGFREARIVYDEIHQPLVVGGMALLYGLSLRRAKAKEMLAELEELARTTYVAPAAFAFAYLGLGDDRVFEWFAKAIDARDPVATHLPSMPLYDGIRDDPRFAALLAKMNLD